MSQIVTGERPLGTDYTSRTFTCAPPFSALDLLLSSYFMGHEKVEAALEANRAHQAALTAYVERLQAELETVDSLLVRVNNSISWK